MYSYVKSNALPLSHCGPAWTFYYGIKNSQKNTLVSIYGPNEDKTNFYKNHKQKIQDFGNENIIICGDWNLLLNPDIDTENYLHINNPRSRKDILKLIEEDNFIDAYRNLHDEKGFIWKKINPEKMQAGLDFFFIFN